MDPLPDMVPTASGDLTKTPLAHVIVFVADRKLHGSLLLHGDDGSRSTILTAAGVPAKVFTSYPGTNLGRVLLQLGYVDDDVLDDSWNTAETTGQLHGEILRSIGAVDEAQLVAGLREQMMRRLLQVFEKLGERTTYSFYLNVNLLHDYGGPELTPIDPYRIVWDGMRLRPNDPSIDPTLARLGSAPIGINSLSDLQRYGFGTQEMKVIEMLALRPMSLAQVLDLDVMPVRQLKVLIYSLFITKGILLMPTSTVELISDRPPAAHQSVPVPRGLGLGEMETPDSAPVARVALKKAVAQSPKPSMPPTLVKEKVLERASQIDNEDLFEVLGIDRGAPSNVAQSAYFGLAKLWHPDRLPEQLSGVRDAASKVFARMSEAHRTLTDPDKRARYLVALDKGAEALEEQAKVEKVIAATIEYQKAEVFLRKRDLGNALKFALNAYEGDPEQAHHVALYAWVLAQQPETQNSKAFGQSLVLLEKAIALNPLCEQAFFFRASLLKQLGKSAAALRDFRKVVELNPRNVDANREVRLTIMRGESKSEAPGGRSTQTKSGFRSTASQEVDWSKDSLSDVVGKLFRKRTPDGGRKTRS
ncbi:MAG: DnaJ domain-containing protein [Polyangiaceae bacterium]|nr:DnaJ domain-containing protein [Polyangiaceae bacterium]